MIYHQPSSLPKLYNPILSVIPSNVSQRQNIKMVSNYLSLLFALFISCLGFVAADADVSSTKGNYQHYAITGVHSGVIAATGARPARRNILNMQKDSVTLYVILLLLLRTARS